MRRGVKGSQVVSRLYNRQENVLRCEELCVAARLSAWRLDEWGLIVGTNRSSIIPKGGRLSNWPRPNSSPAGLWGASLGGNGNHGIAPSRGLFWGLSREASPSAPGDEPSDSASSGRDNWDARCLPTLLSRSSTWASVRRVSNAC
jgi:hypothetical protein